MEKKIPLIVDLDTGIDDAAAIIIAVASKKFDIKLFTCSSGNTSAKNSAKNTLDVLEYINAPHIPVAVGCEDSLVKNREIFMAHGKRGIGDYVFPKNTRKLEKENAIDLIYKTLMESKVPVNMVCLGAITNIAKLISKHPETVHKINKIVFMASSTKKVVKGKTPYVGFNIGKDPEAAEVVVKSHIPLVIVPTELGKKCYLDWEEVFRTKNCGSAGALLENLYRYYKDRQVKDGIPTYDLTAICYLIDSTMYEVCPANIEIIYYADVDTGVGVIDFDKTANCLVCKDIDVSKFKSLYFKLLKKIK